MKLREMYHFVVERGVEADPRGKKLIDADLAREKKLYENFSKEEKAEFDKEKLINPYSDTRILYGSGDHEVRTIMVGIDIDVGEVVMIDRLNQKGQKIDLVISHHPEGMALAGFYEVMRMQADILNKVGVPINVAEDLLAERIKEVERRIMPVNHTRVVDAARLLDIPFMCAHTPSDNQVAAFLQKLMDREKPDTVDEVVKLLKKIPEYKKATEGKAGPKIIKGHKERRAGKVFVEMTGGTEGSKDIFEKLSQAGIGTLVSMHLSEEHFKKAKEEHINIVIAGHIASDTLGMNLLLDKLEKRDTFKIIPCSGFRRVQRK